MAEPKEFPSDKADKFVVRFPDGMRERIKAEADKNKRSMNAEIVDRLQSSLSADSAGGSGLGVGEAIAALQSAIDQQKQLNSVHDIILKRIGRIIEASSEAIPRAEDQRLSIVTDLLKRIGHHLQYDQLGDVSTALSLSEELTKLHVISMHAMEHLAIQEAQRLEEISRSLNDQPPPKK